LNRDLQNQKVQPLCRTGDLQTRPRRHGIGPPLGSILGRVSSLSVFGECGFRKPNSLQFPHFAAKRANVLVRSNFCLLLPVAFGGVLAQGTKAIRPQLP